MPRIHILRPGKFRSCNGREVEFDAGDLRDIAADYERNTAPVIVGHDPGTGDPAHGWAASLSATARGLFAEVPKLTRQMREWIDEGKYRRVSARLVRKAGRWSLDHIGMLGARTPAVSGLDPVELAAGADPADVVVAEIELADGGKNEGLVARTLARALDFVLSRNEEPPARTALAEGGKMADSKSGAGTRRGDDLEARLAAERKRSEELEERLAAVELAAVRSKAAATVKAAVDAGRLTPRWQEPFTALLCALSSLDGETVDLAAASESGEAVELSLAACFAEYLDRKAVEVPQGDLAGPARGEMATRPSPSPLDSDAARERRQLHDRAVALADEKDIPYADAVVAASIELAGAVS